MFQTSLLSDDHVEPLADGVLAVLEKTGILCQNAELLRALADAGARVDEQHERVRFPRAMTAAFVESLRRECAGRTSAPPRFAAPALPDLGTSIAQFYYDDAAQEPRSGNRADLVRLLKLGDVLHGDDGVGHALLLTDVPPLLEPLEAALLLAEYARVPQPAFAWNVRQVDYLVEMGEALGLSNWFSWGAVCFAHPLRFDRDVADKFVRRVRAGVATGLTGMPVAGMTTPVTVEGFIVVSSAEHVATWMAARSLNPSVPLSGSMWSGTVDMKTGAVSYSAFDALFYGFAAVEFLRRWTGMEVPVGGGEYCSAKKPGLYTALEKAYKAMTIAAFTGSHPPIGSGMLDDGRMLSPAQLVLERDLGIGLWQFARPIEPDADRIALPAITHVDLGLTTNHMQTEHTLERFRSCLWLPEIIQRAGWNGPEGEAAMLERARQKVEALTSQYRKPEGREDALAAMRGVVERARRELL